MIHQTKNYLPNSESVVIIVHGIAEHSGRYQHVVEKLNQAGYSCLRYDHLGHGRSTGKRGKIKSFHNHIDTLHDFVLEAKKEFKKVFLLGHSMGGEIVNLYAVKYQDVDGIVSVAAATKTPKNAIFMKYLGFWYIRWLRISTKMFDKHLAKDPRILEANLQDELMLKYIYGSLIGEMFVKGVKYLHKNINEFQTPIIYLHGTSDKIVDVSASKEIYEKLPVADKTLKIYPGEFHEMLNDYNQEKMFKDIIEWLGARK